MFAFLVSCICSTDVILTLIDNKMKICEDVSQMMENYIYLGILYIK